MTWIYRAFVSIMLLLIYYKLSNIDRMDENLQIIRTFATEDRKNRDDLEKIDYKIDILNNDIERIKDKLKID